jgi:hypothetical protein
MILLSILLFVIAGCSSTQQSDTQQMELPQMESEQMKGQPAMTTKIRPGRIHEECLQTLPNQTIEYLFSTSRPVNFNIHYHRDNEVFYPISEESISSLGGSLNCHEALAEMSGEVSEETESFCLMWTNPHDVYVTLDYEIAVMDIK